MSKEIRKKSLLDEFKPKIYVGEEAKPRIRKGQDEKFSDPNCKGCTFKGSFYCWNQCSFNRWKPYHYPP